MWFEIVFISQKQPARRLILKFEKPEDAIAFADKNIRSGEFYKITQLEKHPHYLTGIEGYLSDLK